MKVRQPFTSIGRPLARLFRGGPLGQVWRGAATIISGAFFAGVLGLLVLALSARSLEPALLGLIVLAHANAYVCARFAGFASTEATIRYGADSVETADRAGLSSIFFAGLLLDVIGALAAALLMLVAGTVFALLATSADLALGTSLIFAAALLGRFSGVSTGILRLFGRYDRIAFQQVAVNLVRSALALAGYLLGFGYWFFVVVWAAQYPLETLISLWSALAEMRKRGLAPMRPAALLATLRRVLGLYVFSNVVTAAKSARLADIQVIALFLPVPMLAVYRVSRDLSLKMTRLLHPVSFVLLPLLIRSVASGDRRQAHDLFTRSAAAMFAMSLALVSALALLVPTIIEVGFGAAYREAVIPCYIFLAAIPAEALFQVLNARHIAYDQGRSLMISTLSYAVVYLAAVALAAYSFGLIGAAFVYSLTLYLQVAVLFLSSHRQTKGQQFQPQAPAGVQAIEP